MKDGTKPRHSSPSTGLSVYFCPVWNICYLKKNQPKTKQKNPEENVFSLYEFKFLFLVWTFQFKLFESVISTD